MDIRIFSLFPLIGIIFIGIILFFVLKFYKNEATIPFKDKIKFIRKLIRIVVIIYVIFYIVGIFLILAIGGNFNFNFGNGAGALVLFSFITSAINLYFYYLIFRQYLILMNNFENEIIFEEANVLAFKKIAKIALWIVIFNLSLTILGYLINFILYNLISSGSYDILLSLFTDNETMYSLMNNVEVNTSIDIGILIKFVICIALNLLSVIFEKSYNIYEENRLTI